MKKIIFGLALACSFTVQAEEVALDNLQLAIVKDKVKTYLGYASTSYKCVSKDLTNPNARFKQETLEVLFDLKKLLRFSTAGTQSPHQIGTLYKLSYINSYNETLIFTVVVTSGGDISRLSKEVRIVHNEGQSIQRISLDSCVQN